MRVSRRGVLKGGAAAGVAAATGVLPEALRRVLAAPMAPGRLSDIKNVVILIQENRSFDHYFGAYHGAHGFNEYSPTQSKWNQAYTAADYAASGGTVAPPNPMRPFHLDMATTQSHCTHDIDHQWMTQHKSWNNGAMDKFLSTHLAFDQYTFNTSAQKIPNGPLTMGYYTRADLPFYYALADNFTLCDNYHTSAITGSAANWIYAFTGMIDPAGQYGGPVLSTPTTGNQQDYVTKYFGKMTWTTMMERLEAKGVTWKVYNSPDLNVPALNDNFLTFFKNFYGPSANPTLTQKAFGDMNWAGSHPTSFMVDCANDSLPQVSWLIAPEIWSEHPPAPPVFGEDLVNNIVSALAGNPSVWKKTALFITWDDSGGWFDHVAPLTAPPGTPGEYLTAPDALIADRLPSSLPLPPEARMPIGLGFRVPMLIVSPWSRNPDPAGGPLIASRETTGEVFDHTSMLRFIERLFCVEAPNLTAWRRQAVGDLTSAFNFASPDDSTPTLPSTAADAAVVLSFPECATALSDTEGNHGLPFPYQVPATIPPPAQEPLREGARVRGPSGSILAAGCVAPAGVPGGGTPGGGRAGGAQPNTGAGAPSAGGALEVVAGAALLAGSWWARRRRAVSGSRPADDAEPPEVTLEG